jgi:RNA polymerase sigma-70 factor (ECF subfamily)
MKTDAKDWPEHSRELAPLLARSGLGDRQAFAWLYQLTSSHLFAVVLRIQRDRALAEELLQEVHVAVWKAAAGFDAARSQPLTWLTAIARNRAIDSLRRAAAQPLMQLRSSTDEDMSRWTKDRRKSAPVRWTRCSKPATHASWRDACRA